jgi:hypothetical protein
MMLRASKIIKDQQKEINELKQRLVSDTRLGSAQAFKPPWQGNSNAQRTGDAPPGSPNSSMYFKTKVASQNLNAQYNSQYSHRPKSTPNVSLNKPQNSSQASLHQPQSPQSRIRSPHIAYIRSDTSSGAHSAGSKAVRLSQS